MAVPQLENVAISVDSGAIAILKYNRPNKGNAINVPLLKDVLTGLQWAERNNDIRIVITTGEGRFYTAGLDLLDPTNQQPGATISDEFIEVIGNIHTHLIQTSKTLISAVNGPAPGWGTTSIALSDLVYASSNALFFTPFVQWGLCPEGCSSLTFTRIMGRQKASALLLAGQRFTATEMEAAGLVTKVLPQEGFLEGVLGIARGMAKMPPQSLRFNKEVVMSAGGLRDQLLEANSKELESLRQQVRGKESLEAVAGFAREQEAKKEKSKAGRSTAKL